MHRALVHAVRPPHEEIAHVDDDAVGVDEGSRDPVAGGGEDLETRSVLVQEREAFVVGVGTETDLFSLFFFVFGERGGERFRVRGWWVADQTGDAAGMRHHGVEIGFREVEGECEETEEVA